MNFNENNSKKYLSFLSLLSFCAIATSVTIDNVEPLSRKEAFTPAPEQQSEKQEKQKPFEPIGKSSDEILEEIELDREWSDVIGDDESGKEMLLAKAPTI